MYLTKICILVLVSSVASLKSSAQLLDGITGKADTSYSLYSAYSSSLKSNPETRMVPELDPKSFSSTKDIVYYQKNRRKLLMDAFYPPKRSNKKRIAIIIIHGGGWRSGNRTMHYVLAQHLAKQGYVCFTPEYRLSTEAFYPRAVFDIKESIKWVRQHAKEFNIDTSRIVVAGHSAGGELAAFMGATNGIAKFEENFNPNTSSRVNAVIDIDGILAFIHPESGEGDDSKRISAATYWFGYSKKEDPDMWKEASPLTHVGAQSAPTLFLNSSVQRMHAGREDYIKILNQYKIFNKVKTFEGAPHSFVFFDPWFEPMVKEIDDFLKTVFKK